MHIRTLQTADAAGLLAFELENRTWFEQHIEARAAVFYTPDGVAAHIASYLSEHDNGSMHPSVLVDEHGAIIGRANLRHIDASAGTADVGYRIAHSHARKGLGSQALAHLQQLARDEYGLKILNAWISDENLGSRRVVEKCGFNRSDLAPVVVQIHGHQRRSHLYQCHL